jgi:hypothetical protein
MENGTGVDTAKDDSFVVARKSKYIINFNYTRIYVSPNNQNTKYIFPLDSIINI